MKLLTPPLLPLLLLSLLGEACSEAPLNSDGAGGGTGATAAGGASASGGGSNNSGGGPSGGSASGGSLTGGATAGGTTSGGANSGGAATGGVSSGGGTGGSASGGGANGGTHSGGSAAGGSAGSGGAEATCSEDCAAAGFVCCDGVCVNTGNDINNCGSCGNTCGGATSFCNGSACEAPPCSDLLDCTRADRCCGSTCCGEGQLCCLVNVGPSTLGCFDAVDGTCPKGCPMCVCAAPDTPIATPTGEVPISELRLGDLVYSIDEAGIVVAPIVQVNRTPVRDHTVLAITLDDGRVLRISPGHPGQDGRPLSELVVGQSLHGHSIRALEEVPYSLPETHDILPGSSTGVYFAGGIPIGSTLRPPISR